MPMPRSRFFRIEIRGVHGAAVLLAFLSAANSVLALFRDRLLASSFGASRELDIYYAAFRVPDAIFSLSLFLVASTAFIPIFVETRATSSKRARDFFDSVISAFLIGICIVGIIAFIAMPRLANIVVPGFSEADRLRVAELSRMLLLSPIFLGLSSIFSAVVQASNKFLSFAFAPILYNLGIVLGVMFLLPNLGLPGLALGVVIGAFAHMAVQVPTLARVGTLPRLRMDGVEELGKLVRYSFPRATALSFNQLTILVLTAFASLLGAGSIAIFNLSQNLSFLPLTVIALSYSTAAFPTMVELALQKDKKIFFDHLVFATRSILFWTLPIFGLFLVFRAHLVRLVLGAGAFAWLDTHLTTASLLLFSYAIVTQSLVTLFVRAYYALGRVREPVLYSAISTLVTIIVALTGVLLVEKSIYVKQIFGFFVRLRIEADIAFLSLPLAYSVGAFVNAILLGAGLISLNGKEPLRELARSIAPIAIVACGVSVSGFIALKALGPYFALESFLSVLLQAGIAAGVALAVGVVLCIVLRVREFEELLEAFRARRRVPSRDVLQPDVEHL